MSKMRLVRRESMNSAQEGTEEYKHAIQSVIKCQIQSLLEKLACETGEETIVISTNVSAGTYTQYGSYIGQKYLEDRDEFIQSLSLGFNDFCAEKHNLGVIVAGSSSLSEGNNTLSVVPGSVRSTLPAPRKKTPRKRPLTPTYESSSKRKPTLYSSEITNKSPQNLTSSTGTSPVKGGDSSQSQAEGSNSSQFVENQSSQNGKQVKQIYVSNLPFIKTEPIDEYRSITPDYNVSVFMNGDSPDCMTSHDTDVNHVDNSSKNSIVNRPTSLIPLANIFKRYGTKPVKNEHNDTPESNPEITENEDIGPSEKSILRSLYEQPLYGLDDFGGAASDSEKTGQVTVDLPPNLSDNIDTRASENLVLSGYYDSDNYPSYRHNKKHPVNNNSKKSKNKEKSSPGNTSAANPNYIDSLVTPGGSELKMKMFESNGRLVYACDVCKRELSHLTSYRRHMKLHTMDRPHKCPVCSKGFIRKYHCIDHVNKHHKGVDFDHDTLMLRGSSKGLDDTASYSESLSISPGEYNYTLDQSIEDTDTSLNASIDQSASNMLSELAKSAQKAQLKNQSASENGNQSIAEEILNKQLDEAISNQSPMEKLNKEEESENLEQVAETPNKDTDIKDSQDNDSTSVQTSRNSAGKSDNSSLARKYEVTEGIKAIVAHLKSSSRKKKMRGEDKPSIDTEELHS